MKKQQYEILRKRANRNYYAKESVKGYKFGEYFAAREIKGGWEVTHLPSGISLLGDKKFPSLESAKDFCEKLEKVFKVLAKEANGIAE